MSHRNTGIKTRNSKCAAFCKGYFHGAKVIGTEIFYYGLFAARSDTSELSRAKSPRYSYNKNDIIKKRDDPTDWVSSSSVGLQKNRMTLVAPV